MPEKKTIFIPAVTKVEETLWTRISLFDATFADYARPDSEKTSWSVLLRTMEDRGARVIKEFNTLSICIPTREFERMSKELYLTLPGTAIAYPKNT